MKRVNKYRKRMNRCFFILFRHSFEGGRRFQGGMSPFHAPSSVSVFPSFCARYSLGEMPNFLRKQRVKYLGSLNPTLKARSLMRIFLFSSSRRKAACRRTLEMKARGVSPVSYFSLSFRVERAMPMADTNLPRSKSCSSRWAFTHSMAFFRNCSSSGV